MKANVNIITKQYDENSNVDTIKLNVVGETYNKNNDIYVVYKQTEEGHSTTSTIKICEEEVSIKQFGASNSTMIFKEGSSNITKYRTPQGMLIIETDTKKLIIDKSEKNRIKININYDIKIMDMFQGRNEISILIENKEYSNCMIVFVLI